MLNLEQKGGFMSVPQADLSQEVKKFYTDHKNWCIATAFVPLLVPIFGHFFRWIRQKLGTVERTNLAATSALDAQRTDLTQRLLLPRHTIEPSVPPVPAGDESPRTQAAPTSTRPFTDFEKRAKDFSEDMAQFQSLLTTPLEGLSYAEQNRHIADEWDLFRKLTEEKNELKKMKDLGETEERSRTSVLDQWKMVRRSLAYHRLYAEYKSKEPSSDLERGFNQYLETAGISQERLLPSLLPSFWTAEQKQDKKIRRIVKEFFFKGERLASPAKERMGRESIQWVTGSHSEAIPLILKKTLPHQPPSLVPTGVLLRHNIAPLYGELRRGVCLNGVNQSHLSGVDFSSLSTATTYAQQKDFGFDAEKTKKRLVTLFTHVPREGKKEIPLMRLELIRLLQMGALSPEEKQEWKERLEEAKQSFPPPPISADYQRYYPLFLSKNFSVKTADCPKAQAVSIGGVYAIPIYGSPQEANVLTVISISPDGERVTFVSRGEVCEDYAIGLLREIPQNILEKAMTPAPSFEESAKTDLFAKIEEGKISAFDQLTDLQELIDSLTPLELSPSERGLIENPFSILWGSLKQGRQIGARWNPESILQDHQALGTDIPFLFVPGEHVEEVRRLTKDIKGLHVVSFSVLWYLYFFGLRFSGRQVEVSG